MEKQKLPNANVVLILGILSILTCCCWGIIGMILAVVALVLAKKDIALYMESPELYSNYSNLKTGRILAIIGIVLNAITLIWTIYSIIFMGTEETMEMQQKWMEMIQNR